MRGAQTPADAYQLHWTVPGDGPTPLEGALDAEGSGVTIDGDLPDVAAFALWLAALAPPDAGLHIYDESYSASVPLTADTGLEELTELFLA